MKQGLGTVHAFAQVVGLLHSTVCQSRRTFDDIIQNF